MERRICAQRRTGPVPEAIDHPEAADWSYADESDAADLDADPGMPMSHALTLNALTADHPGGPQLSAHWAFAAGLLAEPAVRDLA